MNVNGNLNAHALDEVTRRQLAWGIDAAKRWLRHDRYATLSSPAVEVLIPSFTGVADAGREVAIDVLAHATIFTGAAKDAMYRSLEWKQHDAAKRTCGIFVPTGLAGNAKEALGLYDFCVEYDYV